MSLVNDQIRALAQRIAHSHGLDLVDIEFHGGGGSKHRTLRIFLERNAAGRAELAKRLAALPPLAAKAENHDADEEDMAEDTGGAIVLDRVEAGEAAGLDLEEDELAYLRELPQGIPIAQLSGITHGDCERFSRDFGTALDVEDLVPGAEYMLEASSPGLDRKLNGTDDFERFVGQLCKLQTFTPVIGNRHWQGHLGAIHDGILTFFPEPAKASRKKGVKGQATVEPVPIALTNIEKAQLVPEF
jgi:ribosome maturation factor RimP